MRKAIFTGLILFLAVTALAVAVESKAVVQSFSGKVEFQNNEGVWSAVSEGMELPLNSMISTGFNSEVVLDLGRSTLFIEPLSRMTIKTLAEKEGVVNTDLFLQVGKVKSEVRSVKGLQTNFTITSPITTASVRGTVFTFDSVSLDVSEGVVVMTDRFRQELTAVAGEAFEGTGEDVITGSLEIAQDAVIITANTADIFGPQGLDEDLPSLIIPEAEFNYGSVRVNWNVYE